MNLDLYEDVLKRMNYCLKFNIKNLEDGVIMKLIFKNSIIISLLTLLIFTTNAQVNSTNSAKKLLLEAQAFMKNTNYKAVVENQALMNRKRGEKIIYHYKKDDGTSLYKCIAIYKGKEVGYELENKKGSFVVSYKSDNKIIIIKNHDFYRNYTTMGTRRMPFKILDRDLNRKNSFNVVKIHYKNIYCYKITMKGELPDDATLAKQKNCSLERIKRDKRKLIENYPTVKVFIIGIKKPYIYKCSYYGSKGKKTFTVNYGIPDFNTNIDLKIFKTPSGTAKNLTANVISQIIPL